MDSFGHGNMQNLVSELLLLRWLRVQGIPPKPLIAFMIYWFTPASGWCKINTDEAVLILLVVNSLFSDFTYCDLLVCHLVSVTWCVRHCWQCCIDSLTQVYCQFSHIYRERNKVVDHLASMGFGLPAPCWCGTTPISAIDLLVNYVNFIPSVRIR